MKLRSTDLTSSRINLLKKIIGILAAESMKWQSNRNGEYINIFEENDDIQKFVRLRPLWIDGASEGIQQKDWS